MVDAKDAPKLILGSTSAVNKQNPLKRLSSKERKQRILAENLQRIVEPTANVIRYQTKEEAQNNGNVTGPTVEKKNVMKHELKVPKAGQLDALKETTIKKLSSN